MIPVGVADQKDFDVAELESELLDARPNERNAFFETAVDQHVPSRCRDKIARQALAANVVQVPGNGEWRERLRPVSVLCGQVTGKVDVHGERSRDQ